MIFILAALSVSGYGQADLYLKGICTSQDSSKNFLNIPEGKPHTWDAFLEYSRGRFLGGGSFGEVRKVTYSHPPTGVHKGKYERIALKRIRPQNSKEVKLIQEEIEALRKVVKSTFFPTIIGCAYKYNDEVMVAQSCVSHSLDTQGFRDAMVIKSIEESLVFYRGIFQGLLDLWIAGYSHCDIKPQNIMTDITNSVPKIIDLGLTQKVGAYNELRGTPIFMSPNKFSPTVKVAQKDDMYSVALTIAAIEAPKGTDDILYQKGVPLVEQCFKGSNPRYCRDMLVKNVLRFLVKAGYGQRQSRPSDSEINFTTLLAEMIEFDSFNRDYNDVLKIIDRLIGQEQAKGIHLKLAEDEKQRRENEVKKLLETRREVEKMDDEKDKIKREKEGYNQQYWKLMAKGIRERKEREKLEREEAERKGIDPKVAKEALELRKKVEGNPKNYVPTAQNEVKELQAKLKEQNDRLAKLDKEYKAKVNALRKNDVDMFRQGQAYKDHKNLLIPMTDNTKVQDEAKEVEFQMKEIGKKVDLEKLTPEEYKKMKDKIDYEYRLQGGALLFERAEAEVQKNQPTLQRRPSARQYKPIFETPTHIRRASNPPANTNNGGKMDAIKLDGLIQPKQPLTTAQIDYQIANGILAKYKLDPIQPAKDYTRYNNDPTPGPANLNLDLKPTHVVMPAPADKGVFDIGTRLVNQLFHGRKAK